MTCQKTAIVLLFFVSFLLSCKRNYKLTPEDYSWMPYKGNEILVFKSTFGATDSIFCGYKETVIAHPDTYDFRTVSYEKVQVYSTQSDPVAPEEDHRYHHPYFVTVQKSVDGNARIIIDLQTKNAWLFKEEGLKLDDLKNQKPVIIKTQIKTYNDIYVITPNDWKDLSLQSNYIIKAYWSKSDGLIRYDMENGIYWELTNKLFR